MNKYRPLLLFVLLLVFSCGLNNTMYNAKKYFNSAQARPLNANGRANNQAIEEYTKSIKKCGIILSDKKVRDITDDALFLMAKALYFKGNSAFQAKDQFEALIKGFPDSPFYTEAQIFLARVYREINRKEDAVKLLEAFIRDPDYLKMHPRALLTLAEFAITDKDYIQAQYWLQKIITEYPKANEYREAFFLFGKNYYVQKDYAASQREFEKLSDSRNIPDALKFEARYYIAMDQYLLGNIDASWKTVQKLLKDEDRPDKVAQIRVLRGRLLIARGEGEDGVKELDDLSKATPRTQVSAEAQYWMGEYYFLQGGDPDKAMAAYNKVRTEFAASEFADAAQKKAAAITQLKQNAGLNPQTNMQQFVDYYVSAAENYFSQFALPDSSLLMYQRIIDSRAGLLAERDTLTAEIANYQSRVDSLTVQIDSLQLSMPKDSLVVSDSLNVGEVPVMSDSLAVADSLYIGEASVPSDSLAVADSVEVPENPVAEESVPVSEETPVEFIVNEGEVVAVADSIIVTEPEKIIPEPEKPVEVPVVENGEIITQADSLHTEIPPNSVTLPTGPDINPEMSEEQNPALPDSLLAEMKEGETEISVEPDSTLVEEKPKEAETPADDSAEKLRILLQSRNAAQSELTAAQDDLETLDETLQRYSKEIIPLALFSQASILSKTLSDSLRVVAIHDRMQAEYPGNKYTNALGAMLSGATVRLIDPAEEEQELRLDSAFAMADSQPDSMLVILNELTSSEYSQIRLGSNFRLGWFYTFERPDTLAAKPFLEEALKLQTTGDYATLTGRFFDGKHFKLNEFDKLVASIEAKDLADSLKLMRDSTAVADTLIKPDEAEKPADGEQTPEVDTERPPGTEPPLDIEQPPVTPPPNLLEDGITSPPDLENGPSQ